MFAARNKVLQMSLSPSLFAMAVVISIVEKNKTLC